jgi:hypothetical protein
MDMHEAIQIIDAIRPLLAGKEPAIQGAALADLLATWLAGHFADTPAATSQLRAQLLKEHITVVRELIPENERELLAHHRKRAS